MALTRIILTTTLILLILFVYPISKDTIAERKPCDPCTEIATSDGCTSSGKQYCGDKCFDPSFQHCLMCNGNPNIYSGEEPTCCGTSACFSSQSCCLDKCYDPDTHVCCSSSTVSNVCGKSHISGPTCCGAFCDYPDDASTMCCNDAPSGEPYMVGNGLSCCYGVGFNPGTQTCCRGPNGGYTRPRGQSC